MMEQRFEKFKEDLQELRDVEITREIRDNIEKRFVELMDHYGNPETNATWVGRITLYIFRYLDNKSTIDLRNANNNIAKYLFVLKSLPK